MKTINNYIRLEHKLLIFIILAACKQLKTIKGCPTTQEFMIEAAEYYLKELKKKKLIT